MGKKMARFTSLLLDPETVERFRVDVHFLLVPGLLFEVSPQKWVKSLLVLGVTHFWATTYYPGTTKNWKSCPNLFTILDQQGVNWILPYLFSILILRNCSFGVSLERTLASATCSSSGRFTILRFIHATITAGHVLEVGQYICAYSHRKGGGLSCWRLGFDQP